MATMATRHQKQGLSPCLYVRARQAIASHQHTDCKGPMSQNMTRLLTKLKPWTAVSALLGLINIMQSYDRAWGTLFIYNQMDVCVCTCACVCAHHSWSITRQSYLIKFERENLTNFSALVPLSSIGKFPKLELIEIFQSYSRFTQRMYEQVLCLSLSIEKKIVAGVLAGCIAWAT